ncbi:MULTISPECIES: hypothetical protein [unclassified Pseudomonas]|uniref:hypothetical protein n=1 Tax=unclassified Pseudomonas TaxID=196821 RepID=UPI001587A97D|nr:MULTISPECIES: hypothetical protein [unclassified Pseudomonas]
MSAHTDGSSRCIAVIVSHPDAEAAEQSGHPFAGKTAPKNDEERPPEPLRLDATS